MDEAKIGSVVDTLQFRQGNISSKALIERKAQDVAAEIKARYRDAEQRITETTDVNVLQKLDSFKKFLFSAAEIIEIQGNHIQYVTRSFDSIDEVYWNTVINGQKLIDEIKFLKGTIENLRRQRDLATENWKVERTKWMKERLKVGRAA